MMRVDVPLGERSYPVLVGHGLMGEADRWERWLPDGPLVVLSNDRVAPLYLDRLVASLGEREVHTLVLPDGEAQKSFESYQRIIAFLAENGIRRDSSLVALGGGVIGDLTGFAAATWMRGIRFVQFPTTLLAQVDASVGGKTAINIPQGKNLVGAFHQPSLVVADTATLHTLDDREYAAGLAEIVKIAAIRDRDFLDSIDERSDALLARDPDTVENVVSRSVAHKADVVAEDEREAGIRATLNLGHSFGHAIETHTNYRRFLHGEAVAMGMVIAARLSEERELCPPGVAGRLAATLRRLDLPVTIPADMDTDALLGLMQLDKKNTAGTRRLVLLREAGHAIIDTESTAGQLRAAIDACREPGE